MVDDAGVLPAEIIQLLIDEADAFVDLARMQVYNTELVTLDSYKLIAVDTVEDVLPRCLRPSVYQAQDLLITDIFRPRHDEVFHDGESGFSKWVGEYAVQPYFRYGHGILEAVLLGSAHISEFQPVTAQLPEVTDISRRDGGCHDKIHPEHAGDVDGVPEIGLLACFTYLGWVRTGFRLPCSRMLKTGIQYLPVVPCRHPARRSL